MKGRTCRRCLTAGTLEGLNDWKRTDYKLYALDTALPNLGQVSKAKLEAAMRPHIVAHAELIGTYQKHK